MSSAPGSSDGSRSGTACTVPEPDDGASCARGNRPDGDRRPVRGAAPARGRLAALVADVGAAGEPAAYMRKTPYRTGDSGAFAHAASARARVRRVSRGSMIPSSHRRAVA